MFAVFAVFEVFFVKDEGRRCGAGGIGTFIRCRTWSGGGRRDVLVVAAREYRTSNRGEA